MGRQNARPVVDLLLVSLGGTAGLRAADASLADSLRRAGASVEVVQVPPARELRTLAWLDFAAAVNARRATSRAVDAYAPRAVIYSTTTAALLAPVPGAIRFDAPARANRPGRHGVWQRPVEARRFRSAPLLLPWSAGGLEEAPAPHTEALVVPMPVAPSEGSSPRDIAAITYGANPHKKGLDIVLAAWLRASRPDEELVVAGVDEREGELWLRALVTRAKAGADGAEAGAGDAEAGAGDAEAGGAMGGRGVPRAGSAPGLPGPRGGRVRFTGMLEPAEYRALLRRSRVFLSAARREDYGIAQLEALADGCILVTTPSPGPYAALPLARALDPRLVGADLAIRTALDDPRPDYVERAAAAVEPFSPAAVDRVVAERVLPRLLQ
jgi:hypothetical protein